ncbi:tRNA modification GTPase [Algibacter sp. R77976]|uniref:tRNA modification GTPase n=1 Tax=Algibacter sp. R77976 TaxID=3093873 RepID=UPI0037CC5CE8
MTKLLTLFLALFLVLNGYTQNSFVKGYYINNSNEKIDCLIKNDDWLNNPTNFNYKTTESSEQKTLTINQVKEFAILNKSKYVRHTVNIDRSTNIINDMDYDKKPIFNKEELFLKVLLEGKANLYGYEDSGLIRYFFNKELTDVNQLVNKNYLTYEGQVAKNNEFRRQLWNELKCEGISMQHLAKINYRQSELIKFFITYNECNNSEFINYQKKQKKNLFNLTLRPGVRSSSLVLKNANYNWKEIDFGKGLTSFRFGLEAEFILGFNNNKWALLLEPTYQNFDSEAIIVSSQTTGERLIANINNESIEVNLGLRYYMYLNDNLKLFTNASMLINSSINSSVAVRVEGSLGTPIYSTDSISGINAAIGFGGAYKSKYNLELRYLPSRNILSAQGAWGTEFSSVSMVLGYSIF